MYLTPPENRCFPSRDIIGQTCVDNLWVSFLYQTPFYMFCCAALDSTHLADMVECPYVVYICIENMFSCLSLILNPVEEIFFI